MQHTSGDMEMLDDALFYLCLDRCMPSKLDRCMPSKFSNVLKHPNSLFFSIDVIQRFDLSSLPDEGALGKAVIMDFTSLSHFSNR